MILEDRIKQTKPFRNQRERLIVNLLYSSTWIQEKLRAHLEAFDITQQQYNVLRILRGKHPLFISTSDIRDRMIDRSPDTSRIVDRLVAKGFCEKSVCPADKRRVDIAISTSGLELLEKISLSQREQEDFVMNLTMEQCEELNRLLDLMKS